MIKFFYLQKCLRKSFNNKLNGPSNQYILISCFSIAANQEKIFIKYLGVPVLSIYKSNLV